MAQIYIFSDAQIPKTLDFHLKLDSKHTITVNFDQFIHSLLLSPILNTFLYQIMILKKLIHQIMGLFEPTLKIIFFS